MNWSAVVGLDLRDGLVDERGPGKDRDLGEVVVEAKPAALTAAALALGSSKRPTSSMKTVPTSERASPIGAMENTPSAGRPPCWRTLLAMRNAGAPMMVMVVPREAAKESGIKSLDGGDVVLAARCRA